MDNSHLRKKLEEKARVESQTLVKGKVFSLKQDILHFEDLPAQHWYIIEHPGAVAMIPVTFNGNLLLIKQWRRPVQKIIYEIPAGCIDEGEPLEQCAQRELQEEIDYRANELISLGSFYSSPGYSNEKVHLFIARGLVASSLDGDEHEAIDIEEIPLSQSLEMIDRGEIQDAKTILALLRYERWIKAYA